MIVYKNIFNLIKNKFKEVYMTLKITTIPLDFGTCLGVASQNKNRQQYNLVSIKGNAYGGTISDEYVSTIDSGNREVRIDTKSIKKRIEEYPSAKNSFEDIMSAIDETIPHVKPNISFEYKLMFGTGDSSPVLRVQIQKFESPFSEKKVPLLKRLFDTNRKILSIISPIDKSSFFDVDMIGKKITSEEILKAVQKASLTIK